MCQRKAGNIYHRENPLYLTQGIQTVHQTCNNVIFLVTVRHKTEEARIILRTRWLNYGVGILTMHGIHGITDHLSISANETTFKTILNTTV